MLRAIASVKKRNSRLWKEKDARGCDRGDERFLDSNTQLYAGGGEASLKEMIILYFHICTGNMTRRRGNIDKCVQMLIQSFFSA